MLKSEEFTANSRLLVLLEREESLNTEPLLLPVAPLPGLVSAGHIFPNAHIPPHDSAT